jgi:hypothetical protein
MIPNRAKPWQANGTRATVLARNPKGFFGQYILPLFFRHTGGIPNARDSKNIASEEQFWSANGNIALAAVSLDGFRLTDWFPRAPGVYWSRDARRAREMAWSEEINTDKELGDYYSPETKMDLIEEGGIGTIRLRPRRIDDEDCWFGTAIVGRECHGGIPLAIPNTVLHNSGIIWGDQINLRGRVRYLQDAGLEDTAASVHHARPLIVFVEEMKGVVTKQPHGPIVITPVGLFEASDSDATNIYNQPQYTFVHCAAGPDAELDVAADWIEKYATKHSGRVITNFDEQRPILADAPLSYQRLVAKTYDRTVINRYAGPIVVERIDHFTQETVTAKYVGGTHVGHNINVGGSAIINIDAVLSNVTQTIGTAPGLDATQKSQLEALVQSLKTDLDKLKVSHADETNEIADALEKAVTNAAKPPQERKKSLLQLSARGLKEAAELVKDIAPSILTTADLIAKFILGL